MRRWSSRSKLRLTWVKAASSHWLRPHVELVLRLRCRNRMEGPVARCKSAHQPDDDEQVWAMLLCDSIYCLVPEKNCCGVVDVGDGLGDASIREAADARFVDRGEDPSHGGGASMRLRRRM